MAEDSNEYPIIDVVWHKPNKRYYNIFLRDGEIWPFDASKNYDPKKQFDPCFLKQKIIEGKIVYFWGDGQVFIGFFA